MQDGDIVKIDVGAFIGGYHGDSANTFAVGNVSQEAKQLMEATEKSFYEGVANCEAGKRLGDVGSAVEGCVKKYGFSVVRDFVGHGIGRSLHEDPPVPNYGKRGVGVRIKEGMTLAIEPMINLGGHKVIIKGWDCITADGQPSAHYENTVAITENGVEILTL